MAEMGTAGIIKLRNTLFILGVLVVTLIIDLIYFPSTLEDAFISFRYSTHLAQGYGLGSWNIDGTRVEGYTSFLWMITLAGGERLGIGVMTLSKVLGIIAHIGIVAFFLLLPHVNRKANPEINPLFEARGFPSKLIGVWLGLSLPICYYATSGMEVIPFAMLIGVALVCSIMPGRSWGICSIVASILLVLIRPEGILIALVFQAFAIYRARANHESIGLYVAGLCAAIGSLLFLTILRLIVYSQPLPNAYYAKASGALGMHIAYGLKYVLEWCVVNQGAVACCIILLVFILSSKIKGVTKIWLSFLLVLFGIYILYIIKAGGDNWSTFPYWRHFVHISPIIGLFVGMALVKVLPDKPGLRWLAVALILLLANTGVFVEKGYLRSEVGNFARNPNVLRHNQTPPYITGIGEYSFPDTVIAVHKAGELPFAVNSIIVDILGLNDPHIAGNGTFDPGGPVDSKTDMDYVMRLRPDIIQGYISAKGIIHGFSREGLVTYREVFSNTMLDNKEFRDNYLFWVNGPYDSTDDYGLFLRMDFWRNHPRKDEIKAVPVIETTLYNEQEPLLTLY